MAEPIRVRGLAERGITRDIEGYDLPLNAYSNGSNVRFADGKVQRSPGYRAISTGLAGRNPVSIATYQEVALSNQFFVFDDVGRVLRLGSSPTFTAEDVSPVSVVESLSDTQWTTSGLGGVLYASRETHPLMYWGPTSTQWAYAPDWAPTDRAKLVRTIGDYVVTLGLTKGAVEHPAMVKWSDLTLYGQPPASWDATSATNSAGENVLSDLGGPIIDACTLGDRLLIYGPSRCMAMVPTGDFFVFRFERTKIDGGVINRNCTVEVEGKQFVFGSRDIYVTDGNAQTTLAEGRVRRWVYSSLNMAQSRRFFVSHSPLTKEVIFHFVSGDADAWFTGATRCNRAAAFCYANDTWSLLDTPNVTGSCYGAIPVGEVTYGTATATYDGIGGSYLDIDDSHKSTLLFVGQALPGVISSPAVWGYDPIDGGSLVGPLDPVATAPSWVERTGIDLDDAGAPIASFKTFQSILPQVVIPRPLACTVTVGASEYSGAPEAWGAPVPFNPRTMTKVDFRASGRYMGFRFRMDEPADFRLSGFDVALRLNGKRP